MGLELCLFDKNVVPGPSKDLDPKTHPTWKNYSHHLFSIHTSRYYVPSSFKFTVGRILFCWICRSTTFPQKSLETSTKMYLHPTASKRAPNMAGCKSGSSCANTRATGHNNRVYSPNRPCLRNLAG